MAQMGTTIDLQQRQTGFRPALFMAAVVLAIAAVIGAALVVGMAKPAGAPAGDHSYDQIEQLRGGTPPWVRANEGLNDKIEKFRGGATPWVQIEKLRGASALSGGVDHDQVGRLRGADDGTRANVKLDDQSQGPAGRLRGAR